MEKEMSLVQNNTVDIYYAENKDLISRYSDLEKYLSTDEKLRAIKLYNEHDRATYVLCHALLRIILARKLDVDPKKITFCAGVNNKPSIPAESLHFNISHTNRAFALAISTDTYVGIDLEYVNQDLDYKSIIERYFSVKESDFILESEKEGRDRFFILWTRKEAFLKELGVGLIDDLNKVEVSEMENIIDKKSFENYELNLTINEHYIYSMKLRNYYLSIAVPQQATINIQSITANSINSDLD